MAANPTRRGSEVSVLVLDAVTSVVTLPLSGLPSTPVNACIAELELEVTASEAETMGESDIEAQDEQILDVPENVFPFLIFLFRLLKIRRQSDSTNSPPEFSNRDQIKPLGKNWKWFGFSAEGFHSIFNNVNESTGCDFSLQVNCDS